MRKFYIFLFCLPVLLFPTDHSYQGSQADFETGKILDKVICQKKANQSYALYLPPAYTPEGEWPILYAVDPGARGSFPLEQFKAAAEKYGYIVVGSNNARNGPWEVIIHSLKSVWDDTNSRFSIDQDRIYVTGFSGGSRAASVFSKIIKQPVAGIIGCGAGLASELIMPEEIAPAYYCGVVGIEDFNYSEMMTLDREFDRHDVNHRLFVFQGGHDWPSPELCQRLIGWMEIVGMKNNIRLKDDGLIQEIFENEIAQARGLESSDQTLRALSTYDALVSLSKDWQVVDGVETRIERIKKSRAYTRALKEEKNHSEKEQFHLNNFIRVFDQIESNPPTLFNLKKIFRDLHLNDLLKKTKSRNSSERALAIRLLQTLESNSSNKGWTYLRNSDDKKAILSFEVALKASREDSLRRSYLFYNLACAYSRNGNKNKALKNLKLAVDSGFKDLAHIEKDEDLDSIKNTPEFERIIELLRKK